MKIAIAVLFVASLLGCSDNPTDPPVEDTDGNMPDVCCDTTNTPDVVDDTEDEPDTPTVECEPNSILSCLRENARAIEKCRDADMFYLEPRGITRVKGKGEMETYMLRRHK